MEKHECDVPCKAINGKLVEVWVALREKVTNRTFFSLIIPLWAFCVIVIGGAQWAIYQKVNDIKTGIAVHVAQIQALHDVLDAHIDLDFKRTKYLDEKIERRHPPNRGYDKGEGVEP